MALVGVASLGLGGALLACSSDGASPTPPALPDAESPAAPVDAGSDAAPSATIEWSACDLAANKHGGAECASVDVPLDYTKPDGPKVTLGLKRVLPSSGKVTAHVWLVDGGPGGSITNGFTGLGRSLLDRDGIAVYGVDHRGVGASHPLLCPNEEAKTSAGGPSITDAEWPACVADLAAREAAVLPHFTTSNAMRDLAHVIERAREPGAKVIVFGGSYGTYATLRYMKLFPDQADGVILEGIVSPGTNFDTYDVDMNGAAKDLFDTCKADPSCAAHFSGDPWAEAGAVVASFGAGHCPVLNLDADGARYLLGGYLFYSPIREYLPALVTRMKRCAPSDVTAIVKFYQALAASMGASTGAVPGGFATVDPRRSNRATLYHVALSEMWHWEAKPTVASVLATWREGTMSTGLTVQLAERQDTWPVYSRGPEVDAAFPPWKKPLLMLQGGLDAATPIAQARRARAAYSGPAQTWMEFPQGAHTIMDAVPTTDGDDCARIGVLQFVANPGSALDTSCLQKLAPINFDGTPSVNQFLLGTANAWE